MLHFCRHSSTVVSFSSTRVLNSAEPFLISALSMTTLRPDDQDHKQVVRVTFSEDFLKPFSAIALDNLSVGSDRLYVTGTVSEFWPGDQVVRMRWREALSR